MGLRELIVRNFSLIDNIDIEFTPGLNVITGQTGAGKTLLLKAIEFALGARLDSKYVRPGERGSVTLLMDVPEGWEDMSQDDDELIVKREIDKTGRTKMYINGELVPQAKARELFFKVFEFHGQFSNISLLNKKYQTDIYDMFLGEGARKIKSDIRDTLFQLKDLYTKLEEFNGDMINEEISYLRAQIQEFESLGIDGTSEEKLKDEERLLRNAKEIVEGLSFSYDLLYDNDTSVVSLLAMVKRELGKISRFSGDIERIMDRIDTVFLEIEDISGKLYDFKEKMDIDQSRLDEIEGMLSQIFLLKRKYRVGDLEDIILYIDKLKAKLDTLSEKKEDIDKIKEEIGKKRERLKELAQELSRLRKEKQKEIEEKVEKNIRDLGLPYARFKVSFTKNTKGEEIDGDFITEEGKEGIEFLFSANPDRTPDILSKIASGGELSRVMLGIKSVFSQHLLSQRVLLFDEIDQGVGERLGDVVGKKLKSLSIDNQVVVITHLSQIAKLADNHIFVEKHLLNGKTVISARILRGNERESELLRMLGGEEHIKTLRRE